MDHSSIIQECHKWIIQYLHRFLIQKNRFPGRDLRPQIFAGPVFVIAIASTLQDLPAGHQA